MIDSQYLETEFDTLLEKISNLSIHKAKAKAIYDRERKRIQEFHEQLPDWSDRGEKGQRYYFHFTSPSTGEEKTYKSKPLKLADEIEFNELQKLKTYHWLLAEAYEAFEDFIERVYAYCGLLRNRFWVQPDNWAHGESSDFKHYYNPKRKSKDTPYKQLEILRQQSQHFSTYEVKPGNNLRVVFVLIEKLRHIIVHKGGCSDDLKGLKGKIHSELKGMSTKNLNLYVDSYFITYKGDKLIDLLDYPAEDGAAVVVGAYHDSMDGFFTTLVEYAQLVKESIELDGK